MKKKTRDILIVIASAVAIFIITAIVMLFPTENSDQFIQNQTFEGTHEIVLTPAETIPSAMLIPANFTVFEQYCTIHIRRINTIFIVDLKLCNICVCEGIFRNNFYVFTNC